MDKPTQHIDTKGLSIQLEKCIDSVQAISEELMSLVNNATQYLGERDKDNYAMRSEIIGEKLEEDLCRSLSCLYQDLSIADTVSVYASPEVWMITDMLNGDGNTTQKYPKNYSILE